MLEIEDLAEIEWHKRFKDNDGTRHGVCFRSTFRWLADALNNDHAFDKFNKERNVDKTISKTVAYQSAAGPKDWSYLAWSSRVHWASKQILNQWGEKHDVCCKKSYWFQAKTLSVMDTHFPVVDNVSCILGIYGTIGNQNYAHSLGFARDNNMAYYLDVNDGLYEVDEPDQMMALESTIKRHYPDVSIRNYAAYPVTLFF